MSFKIKTWGCGQTISVVDYYPQAHSTDGSGGLSYVFPWGGKLLFLCYDGSYQACWFIYDPVAGWEGPHYPTGIAVARWDYHNPLYGQEREYKPWGKTWLLSYGMPNSGNSYANDFFAWDENLNWVYWPQPTFGGTVGRGEIWVGSLGVDVSGLPCRTLWQFWDYTDERLVTVGPGGTAIYYEGPKVLWWYVNQGLTVPGASRRGPYWQWYVGTACSPPANGNNLYSTYVVSGQQCVTVANVNSDPRTALIGDDGGVYATVTDRYPDPDTTYLADLRDPLSPVGGYPWQSTWHRRRMRDGGGYALDPTNYELSGVDQSLPYYPVQGDVTRMADGRYLGVATYPTAGHTATYFLLDPEQPISMARHGGWSTRATIGYIGTYAVKSNLRVENILPAPATPAFTAGPVIERADGTLISRFSAWLRSGATAEKLADILVNIGAYPWDDPLFLWPGTQTDGVCEGLFEAYADGPTGIMWARMPDQLLGMYVDVGPPIGWIPGGQGMGVLRNEHLVAGGAPTHTLSPADLIASSVTTFQVQGFKQIISPLNLDDPDPRGPLIAYTANEKRVGLDPWWIARVGRFDGTTWTTVLDFATIGPPGLGEASGWPGRKPWTVWSIARIPPWRFLPEGGWLVGATLYFAPWAEEWELDVGSRDATFRDTGYGYVAAKPGSRGPCQSLHEPQLLGADPYDVERSLYGPDALLVYDNAGQFLECLSDITMYPADGREILVTAEAVPRLIYRVYKEGTYSDYAEGWGAYHGTDAAGDIHAPLYACYDLFAVDGLKPGAGRFRGFLDMYDVPAESGWRWPSCGASIYDPLKPRQQWLPGGRAELRQGRGGQTVIPLGSRSPSSRQGTKGVGQRA